VTGIPQISESTAPATVDDPIAPRHPSRWIKPTLIGAIGVLGLLIALLALLPLVGWGVVRLASGSMSPTLPTDSLLLVRQVDASSVRTGDVVTVQRPAELPITHRVVSMVPGVAPGQPVTLTLKGDANDTVDPAPYTVATVQLVTVGLPWGGQVVTAVRSPYVLGGITIVVSLLVLWAWWPRRPERG
jgi:signal peptidase